MPRKPSIDETIGEALFTAYQRLGTIAGAAREVGVSESAARRYLAETPKAATPIVASQRQILETAGASLFETRAALEQNYQRILGLEQKLNLLDLGNPKAVEATAKVIREIRGHIESGVKIYELWLSVEAQRQFREAVLEAIAEADESTRARIIAKLRDRRAVGLALSGS
jgi:molybdenum-dependent DNA-binding transcriptional regulator ModE